MTPEYLTLGDERAACSVARHPRDRRSHNYLKGRKNCTSANQLIISIGNSLYYNIQFVLYNMIITKIFDFNFCCPATIDGVL